MKPTIFSAKGLVLNIGLLLSCPVFAASLQNALNNEITARQNGDTALQSQINTEIANRQSADTTESNARQTGDAGLQLQINTEASSRQNGDADLQAKVDNEVGTRQVADTTLQTNINTEAGTRQATDNKLQDQITNIPIPVYAYTLVVSKDVVDDSTGRSLGKTDFTSIGDALTSISPDPYSGGACSAHYLIKVLPGTYAERFTMKPCVDIEGSGELITKITAAGADGCGGSDTSGTATVSGANAAELRFLTVENTAAGGVCARAILNNGTSPRLTQVTASASGGTFINIGVQNIQSSPMMTNVTATASGGSFGGFGVFNNDYSSPTMTNVTATATCSSGSCLRSVGVINVNSSSSTMTNVTATASGSSGSVIGTGSVGVYNNDASSSSTIHRSTLSGQTNSIFNSGGTVLVGASQLVGPVSGSATCAASYKGDFTPLSTACQ